MRQVVGEEIPGVAGGTGDLVAGGEFAARVGHRSGCPEQRLAPLGHGRIEVDAGPGRLGLKRELEFRRGVSSRSVGSREACISSGDTMAPRAWACRFGLRRSQPEGLRALQAEEVWCLAVVISRSRTGPMGGSWRR